MKLSYLRHSLVQVVDGGERQIQGFNGKAEEWVLIASVDRKSVDPPPAFFKENYDQWKNHYAEANEIFQKACQAELDFWDIALSPGAR